MHWILVTVGAVVIMGGVLGKEITVAELASLTELGRLLRPRYSLPAIHACLYLTMWACYYRFHEPLANGITGWFFVILMIADLPFSLVAFSMIWDGGTHADIAAIGWGIVGTVWWCVLGVAIEAFIRRRSRPEKSSSE